jgi:hypothetical protein
MRVVYTCYAALNSMLVLHVMTCMVLRYGSGNNPVIPYVLRERKCMTRVLQWEV